MKIKPLADRVVIKLVEEEEKIASYKGNQLPDDVLKQAKKDGFADKYISKLLDVEEKEIRNQRLAMGMHQVWNLFMYQVQKIVLIITLHIMEKIKMKFQ